MTDLPIVCTLTPEALQARREGLLTELMRQAFSHEPLPEGLRVRFAPSSEALAAIVRAVDAERHCCRFLRFAITVEPADGPMVLEISGPPGAGAFVAALLEG